MQNNPNTQQPTKIQIKKKPSRKEGFMSGQ